jgi:transcriptional regulator with XRE-family HTH domain
MDRQELAAFLRSRRERLQPSQVGLPARQRRRTPGLRREDVAQLAYISTEYYTRLEQARSSRPSRRVLAGIVRALRLSDAERDHLYHLAGEAPGPPPGPIREVRQSILDLLDRLPQAAAMMLDAAFEVIAWNPLATALMEDFSALPPRERNLIRRLFLHPDPAQRHYGLSNAEEFGQFVTGHLRAAAARYPDSPDIRALVDELAAGSDEFATLWASHHVRTPFPLRKTMRHPAVGPITLNCDILALPDQDQHVVIFTADPGSTSDQALRLLAVLGTQSMDVPRQAGL